MPQWTQLRGISDVTQQQLTTAISDGLLAFYDWGVLNAGGFVNVPVTTPGTNDPYADETLLPLVNEGTADNTVWEARHGNWVYATGLEFSVQPTQASGVYVDGVYYPTASTSGNYRHHLDYTNGRVVFSSGLPPTSVVQAEYAYRWINFYDQDVPWFKDVVMDAFQFGDTPTPSGFVKLLNDNRIELPAVIIEPVMTRRQRGMMLGSTAVWVDQDILFHIVGRRADERNNIMDILSLEKDRTIYLYDVNARRAANDFAFDWRGSPVPGAKMYPQLVDMAPSGYRWKKAFFTEFTGQDVSLLLPMYRGIVRGTLELDFDSM